MQYCAVLLPENPTLAQLQRIVPDYQAMLVSTMTALAERYERRPDYPFIDTKLDLISGDDFPNDDPIRGLQTIYGWIQGRGLEALAGHLLWLYRHPSIAAALPPRLARMMADLLVQLRRMRARNAGHLHFFMTPTGEPSTLDANGRQRTFVPELDAPYGYSDLFCAKGMYAAARVLGDLEATAEARAYCLAVDEAVHQGNFASDQQPLDPKNPVQPVPGRHLHGPYMLQLGTAALMTALEANADCVEFGLRQIRYEMAHHINLDGHIAKLHNNDFWEAIDDSGQPYLDDNFHIICDPGHALEYVGLALKFTQTVGQTQLASAAQKKEIAAIEATMPAILQHNFTCGFQTGPGGICKSFDLLSRRPINTDMPWWNLPETLRAALLCHSVATDDKTRQACLNIFAACHNAFTSHYVRPDLHLMALQTRSALGRPVPVIPATADADPGCHTGLSLIDVLATLATLSNAPDA